VREPAHRTGRTRPHPLYLEVMNANDAPPVLAPQVGTLDERRLARLRRLGNLLDNSIGLPGTPFRFGLDAVIGLVPGIGDLIGGVLSLYIIVESSRLGVPRPVLARMAWNVALDTFVGEVPILGDLFDAGYKSNLRNLELLDGHLQRPAESRRSNRRFLALIVGGLVLLTAGTVTLAVLLVHFLSALLR
jgi:hypothetical protein